LSALPIAGLVLAIRASAAAASPQQGSKSPIDRLDRSVWVQLELWENPDKLSAKRRAELKSCVTPSMSFEKNEDGLVQIFYAGVAMHTRYAPVKVSSDKAGTTLSLYNGSDHPPAEILRLNSDGTRLVQESAGFRPHIFLRCTAWDTVKPPNQKRTGPPGR
jgi:hypothetical protein